MKLKISLIIAIFILSSFNLSAQTSTTSPGNWNNGAIWSSGLPGNNSSATINHPLNLNIYLGIGNGTYVFNAPVYTTSNSISTWGYGNLTINARTEVQNISLNNNFSLNVLSCDTLFINGNFNLTGNTNLYVADCAVIIVNGNLAMHNNVDATVNGILYVNGTLTATGNSGVDGNGSIQSGGQTNIWNNAEFFGNSSACPGGCSYGSGAGLPIELKSFEAKLHPLNKNLVEIKWTTLTEINNQLFVIEHSTDGKHFEEVNKVEGAGNSNRELSYSLLVNIENNATQHYYRLKQIDYDGTSKTFNAVALQQSNDNSIEANHSVEVYPNPTNGEKLKLSLQNFEAGVYDLVLMSSNGQMIVNNSFNLQDGATEKLIDLLNGLQLSKGIYYARMIYKEELITKKIIVN